MTLGIKIRARRLAAALLAGSALLAAAPAAAPATERAATPATLASEFAAAQAGDTLLLATGNYGVFRGGMKTGEVVLRPQPGAAVTMELSFAPAAGITIDGVTLTEVEIGGRDTRNITIRNADVPGQTTVRTGELQNANILFDRNVYRDWNKTDACRCGEGRISLQGENSQPTGITIQNSEFRGGMSDGIQNGSTGTRIIDNTFHDLTPGTPDGVHTDAIQLYGSKNTLIKGNYFYDIGAAQIMSPDGADHEIIEDNVFGPGDYPFAITLWSDDGSIIRHNTMVPGPCWFNLRCGIVSLGQKSSCAYASECDPGRGTLIEDNILASTGSSEGVATFTSRHNLYTVESARGANDLLGKPLFAGGAQPTTYDGFRLAAGSPGRGNASDGLDRGIRPRAETGGPSPAGAPPTPVVAGAPTAAAGVRTVPRSSIRVLSRLRTIRKTGTLRLQIRTTKRGLVVVSGLLRPGRLVAWASGRHSRKAIGLRSRSLGTRAAGSRIVTMRLGPNARRILGRSRDARLSVRLRVGSDVTWARVTIKR